MMYTRSDWINDVWYTEEYQTYKKENFLLIDRYLSYPPSKILDIGCGLAWESRMFNEKYNSELWLLDGDVGKNDSKSALSSDASWHDNSEDFLFYHSLQALREELEKLGTKNYHLIDTNNINISKDVKFDLITSWVSCGFHYPVNTYIDLIRKHSHDNTVIVMDLRKRKRADTVFEDNLDIVQILNKRQKYFTCVINL